ncbi:hypothetical protein [Streptomyces venezuelae]|uniref:hypothetical protein n=1 Tax=Streptomyces venezuelae TaxID=54571 RepID=UPI001CC2281F|nr:hypothetical protein [Streptomyces venezuelae]
MAGLLFAALALFVVGFAGAARSDGQGAADAAALAAAGEVRDDVFTGLVLDDLTPDDWGDLLGGDFFDVGAACAEAGSFAAQNDASVTGCEPALPRVTVDVRTNRAVGDSVVPGTESTYAVASATAVIEPRCTLDPAPTATATPSPTPNPPNPPTPPVPDPVNFLCEDGKDFKLDPLDPGEPAELARRLFKVRLDG